MVENLYRGSCVGYNAPMPKVKRPKRVTIMVTEQTKALAQAIAAAMNSESVKWTETDSWEQGVLLLATRKDVREALAAKAKKVAED